MRKFVFFSLSLVFVGALAAIFQFGGSLAAPQMRSVGEPPDDFPAERVEIRDAGQTPIAGWFAAGEGANPGVLLLHGIRSDRRAMLGRARFLREAGYSVLLIDLQAHGETPGENITFGVEESNGVHAAIAFLRSRVNGREVGVIGVSLGGAAALLGEMPIAADAVILEAVYSSIETAVKNRIAMRLGETGEYLVPLFTWQIQPRLGIPLEALSPHAAIRRLSAPVMIIAGTEDRRTRIEETRGLFHAAAEPKELWLIDGARHQNLHAYAGDEYEEAVLRFFQRHLGTSNG